MGQLRPLVPEINPDARQVSEYLERSGDFLRLLSQRDVSYHAKITQGGRNRTVPRSRQATTPAQVILEVLRVETGTRFDKDSADELDHALTTAESGMVRDDESWRGQSDEIRNSLDALPQDTQGRPPLLVGIAALKAAAYEYHGPVYDTIFERASRAGAVMIGLIDAQHPLGPPIHTEQAS